MPESLPHYGLPRVLCLVQWYTPFVTADILPAGQKFWLKQSSPVPSCVSVCVFVCVSVCLCLCVCLPACLPAGLVCLSVCLPACLCLSAFVSGCRYVSHTWLELMTGKFTKWNNNAGGVMIADEAQDGSSSDGSNEQARM